jgi:hypothetical protein
MEVARPVLRVPEVSRCHWMVQWLPLELVELETMVALMNISCNDRVSGMATTEEPPARMGVVDKNIYSLSYCLTTPKWAVQRENTM